MAGIDNIINEILQEAKDKAQSLLDAAKAEADGAYAKANAECADFKEGALEKIERNRAIYQERLNSQKEMRRRQAVLKTKQEIIEEVIQAAYKKLAGQDDAAYFAMLLKLTEEHAQKGAGEMLLSGKDLARVPADFADQISAVAQKKGGSLRLSDQAADIENGFILRYSGIDENCTLTALFAEKTDELSDRVHEVLW